MPSVVAFPGGLAGTVADGTLRVWNPASEAIGRFARIARFDDDAAWVTSGRYEPVRDGLEARGSVLDAAGVPLPVAGHVTTTVGDVAVRLVAVRSAAFRGSARLQLIVQDATSALPEDDPSSTYSMGRFLYFDDGRGPAEVALDWTPRRPAAVRLLVLFACPVPPAENRMPVAITAGERHPVDTSGTVLH